MNLDLAFDLGQRIVKARNKLGMSQSVFGAKADMSQTTLSSIERGAGGATLENLTALVNAHDLNPVWLLLGRGPMFPREAFQPHVLQSVTKTSQMAAEGIPSVIDLIGDEELATAADLSFDDVQYLADFLRGNPALNRYIKKEGLLPLLEARRKERLDRVSAAEQLLRDRANRLDKGN